jgi:hypothetical protein
MSKCERKVVRKFALETEKLMHSLYPMDRANKATNKEQESQAATTGRLDIRLTQNLGSLEVEGLVG